MQPSSGRARWPRSATREPEQLTRAVIAMSPLRVILTAEEVAEPHVILASSASRTRPDRRGNPARKELCVRRCP